MKALPPFECFLFRQAGKMKDQASSCFLYGDNNIYMGTGYKVARMSTKNNSFLCYFCLYFYKLR